MNEVLGVKYEIALHRDFFVRKYPKISDLCYNGYKNLRLLNWWEEYPDVPIKEYQKCLG